MSYIAINQELNNNFISRKESLEARNYRMRGPVMQHKLKTKEQRILWRISRVSMRLNTENKKVWCSWTLAQHERNVSFRKSSLCICVSFPPHPIFVLLTPLASIWNCLIQKVFCHHLAIICVKPLWKCTHRHIWKCAFPIF